MSRRRTRILALRLAAGLRAISLMASPLTAALATQWIDDGTLDALTAAIRAENQARQRLAATLLPADAVTANPDGNHLWLTLPWPVSGGPASSPPAQRGRAAGGRR